MPYHVLKSVIWSAPSSHSLLLTSQGFPHEFVGVAGSKPENLCHLLQVHSSDIVEARPEGTSPSTTQRTRGDGLWSCDPLQKVSVKTADCLPVLIAHPPSRTVFAVHAGWRGLTSGILGKAISKAQNLGISAESLMIAVGPAISRECYEVGEEVVEALFTGNIGLNHSQASLACAKGKGDRWHLDLKVAAVFTLLNAGLRPHHIEVLEVCTFQSKAWHSFRREGVGCGSNWTWISGGVLNR